MKKTKSSPPKSGRGRLRDSKYSPSTGKILELWSVTTRGSTIVVLHQCMRIDKQVANIKPANPNSPATAKY